MGSGSDFSDPEKFPDRETPLPGGKPVPTFPEGARHKRASTTSGRETSPPERAVCQRWRKDHAERGKRPCMKGLPDSCRTNRNAPPAWQVTLTDNRGPRTRLTGNVQLCGQRCWTTPTPRLVAPLCGFGSGVKRCADWDFALRDNLLEPRA